MQLIDNQHLSTEGGNRTRTRLPSLDFESSASTNSTTSAYIERRFALKAVQT